MIWALLNRKKFVAPCSKCLRSGDVEHFKETIFCADMTEVFLSYHSFIVQSRTSLVLCRFYTYGSCVANSLNIRIHRICIYLYVLVWDWNTEVHLKGLCVWNRTLWCVASLWEIDPMSRRCGIKLTCYFVLLSIGLPLHLEGIRSLLPVLIDPSTPLAFCGAMCYAMVLISSHLRMHDIAFAWTKCGGRWILLQVNM